MFGKIFAFQISSYCTALKCSLHTFVLSITIIHSHIRTRIRTTIHKLVFTIGSNHLCHLSKRHKEIIDDGIHHRNNNILYRIRFLHIARGVYYQNVSDRSNAIIQWTAYNTTNASPDTSSFISVFCMVVYFLVKGIKGL